MATAKVSGCTVMIAVIVAACGGSSDSLPNGGRGGAGNASGEPELSGVGATSGSNGGVCEADAAPGGLRPLYLAFAFDVSGSLGNLEQPWHDPVLKWEPIVAASKAFFADPASSGISASLTFFPIDADEEAQCDPDSYAVPDVPMTGLPSNTFGDAIDAIGPWFYGTPTLAVVGGLIDFIQPMALDEPGSSHAMVLVTDGSPAGCADPSINAVTSAVGAVADTIPTFVIGVANPPGGPDSVSSLNAIAAAGGTQQAYIVQTGDPEQTKLAFEAAVDAIRQSSVSCEVDIPAVPGGQPFDPSKVNVTYTSGQTTVVFVYDETCSGENSWHYDDPLAPTSIVLCDGACEEVSSDPVAGLHVEFGCETIDAPK